MIGPLDLLNRTGTILKSSYLKKDSFLNLN